VQCVWNNNILSVSSLRFILVPLLGMRIIFISFFLDFLLYDLPLILIFSCECCKTINDGRDFFCFNFCVFWDSLVGLFVMLIRDLVWRITFFLNLFLQHVCYVPNFIFYVVLELVLDWLGIPQVSFFPKHTAPF
jgi:hypothetical protein